MEYLHAHGWVYRDLKPSNVVFDAEGHVHLVDFGLCKRVEGRERRWSTGGSVEYLSPEVLESGRYDSTVDWWALGVVVWEMLSGEVPKNGALEKPWYMSVAAFNLCYRLLERDGKRRLGASGSEEVRSHPFFGSVDWEAMRERRVRPPCVVCSLQDNQGIQGIQGIQDIQGLQDNQDTQDTQDPPNTPNTQDTQDPQNTQNERDNSPHEVDNSFDETNDTDSEITHSFPYYSFN